MRSDVGDHSALLASKVCSVLLWDGVDSFPKRIDRTIYTLLTESNLVDSASSHTLVSKIKPCMSKYKQLYTVKLRTAH